MKQIKPNDINPLLLGSAFYGCGGGGSPAIAARIGRSIPPKSLPQLKLLSEFKENDLVVTAYTVGGLESTAIETKLLKNLLARLQTKLNAPIAGIIPVEIGPLSVFIALKTASLLDLPLVDADFVGGRSSPEVFLETITLFNLPRTPIYIADAIGNCAVLENSSSAQTEELFLRQFASLSGKPALVLGYPSRIGTLTNKIVEKTVTQALKIGRLIQQKKRFKLLSVPGLKKLYTGTITKLTPLSQNGFSSQEIVIDSSCKIFAKNENLICWLNRQVVSSCPDLIIMTDAKANPLYNTQLNIGTLVDVYALKAPALWRSKSALALFNPKVFGYNFSAKLLQ